MCSALEFSDLFGSRALLSAQTKRIRWILGKHEALRPLTIISTPSPCALRVHSTSAASAPLREISAAWNFPALLQAVPSRSKQIQPITTLSPNPQLAMPSPSTTVAHSSIPCRANPGQPTPTESDRIRGENEKNNQITSAEPRTPSFPLCLSLALSWLDEP